MTYLVCKRHKVVICHVSPVLFIIQVLVIIFVLVLWLR